MTYPIDLVIEDIRGWDFRLQATIDEREDVKDIYIYGMRRTWDGWFKVNTPFRKKMARYFEKKWFDDIVEQIYRVGV
jgi:hypothetical protein